MIEGLHFVRYKGKSGIRWYVYAWRGGPRIMTADGVRPKNLTREAVELLDEALESQRAIQADMLAGLAREWRPESPEWKKLAATTKDTWGRELDLIEDKWGTTPLAVWNDPRMVAKVVAWRDSRSDTPRAADIGVTVLAELLKFGRLRARVLINVAEGVPAIYQGADRAEIIWTDDDIAAFSAAKLARKEVVDILRLATLTGFRRADLAAVTLDEVGPEAIIRVAQKKSRGRRRRAVIPLLKETVALIDELRGRFRKPGVTTLLVNSYGEAWKPASMTMVFNKARDESGIRHGEKKKHLHDCRGTFVTKLCRAGLTNEEIANVVGWSVDNVDRIRRVYVDDAAVVVALSKRIAGSL